ncbi:hypothetical protein LCGC14_0541090 [marine sediment metagenome]|uniref:Uncharacterized protein n=1 Tax=marine sediment metagenome TaxID=412755 RepID=A0A0F9RSR2_9ZZZZ
MESPRNILLVIMTPCGPSIRLLTHEELDSLLKSLNLPIKTLQGQTPIPEVFEDAFTKEE